MDNVQQGVRASLPDSTRRLWPSLLLSYSGKWKTKKYGIHEVVNVDTVNVGRQGVTP